MDGGGGNSHALHPPTQQSTCLCREEESESGSAVSDSATPWTIQSMEFSRPEYWSGQLFPSPGNLLNPGIELRSPALQVDSLPAVPQGKPVGKQVMGNKKGCVMFLFWLCLASFLYFGNIFVFLFFFFKPKRGCRRKCAGTGQNRRHLQRRWEGGRPLGRRRTRRSRLSQKPRCMGMPVLPKLLKEQ